MTRTYGQKPFRLRKHLERAYAGLKYIGIDCGMTIDEMESATLETLSINRRALEDADAQIMHNISRGPLPMYRSVFGGRVQPTVTISCWPYWWHLAPYASLYRAGVSAVTPPQRSVPAHLIDPKVKSRSRIHYQLANVQAQNMEAGSWALLTDDQGRITEGTGANFFVVRDGRVLTAPGRDILLGVTREAVLELLNRLAIPTTEQDYGLYEVTNAEEAFFTATSFAIMPCTRINAQPIGDGAPGAITRRLMGAWSEMVGVDVVAQADHYASRVASLSRTAVAPAQTPLRADA